MTFLRGTLVAQDGDVVTVEPFRSKAFPIVKDLVVDRSAFDRIQAAGGFGSAITELLSEHHQVPIRRIGVQDRFGQSGSPDELLAHYGLDAVSIENAVRTFVEAH